MHKEVETLQRQAEMEALAPDEVIPQWDYLLLRPTGGSEKVGRLYLPEAAVIMRKELRDAFKKQFGTIIEKPRLTVIAVGEEVEQYKVGDEVIVDRKAVAFEGTAVNISGYGVHLFCHQKSVCGLIKRKSRLVTDAGKAASS